MINFCFDIETLSTESNCVILSAAITWFDPAQTDVTYEELVERSLYVKFDAIEQKKIGRVVSKDTLEWWSKQGEIIRNFCLLPSKKDVSAVEGVKRIREYVKQHGSKDSFIWARGNFDQMAIDSLAKSVGEETIADYNAWCDIRTAIRLLKETSKWTGYCDIPDFDMGKISKHNPIDDLVLDILMLVRGV